MPTHIDVLVGDYTSCIYYNYQAIIADEKLMRISPDTAGTDSFYFGYSVHSFHMLVYGAILGGMESIAMDIAHRLNTYLNEDVFVQNPDLTVYLEAYSALDIHIMVRFGRWKEIGCMAEALVAIGGGCAPMPERGKPVALLNPNPYNPPAQRFS